MDIEVLEPVIEGKTIAILAKKYIRASGKKLIQIISVEYFQNLFKLDGTLIETAVSNSKKHFFLTPCANLQVPLLTAYT